MKTAVDCLKTLAQYTERLHDRPVHTRRGPGKLAHGVNSTVPDLKIVARAELAGRGREGFRYLTLFRDLRGSMYRESTHGGKPQANRGGKKTTDDEREIA